MKIRAFVAFVGVFVSFIAGAMDRMERTKWWREDRFGLFLHFGIYSLAARDEKVLWYEKMTAEAYEKYFEMFNPDLFDAREWARCAKKLG